MAYLAGGKQRLIESAVTELIAGGQAEPFRQQLQLGPKAAAHGVPEGLSGIAKCILSSLQAQPSINRSQLNAATKLPVAKISGALASAGLVESRIKRHALAWMSVLIMIGILGIGVFRIIQASGTGRPIGFLVMEMIVVVAIAGLLVLAVPNRTKAGKRVLAEKRKRFRAKKEKTLKDLSDPRAIGLMVGLYGTAVLVGTGLSGFHTQIRNVMSPEISTGGGGSGDGCGASCGGGCGGGCGGCGG